MRRSFLVSTCLLAALLGRAAAAEAPNLVRNPGFEEVGAERPVGWEWGIGGDAKASLTSDPGVRHTGAASLRLASSTPASPNVYGSLSQRIDGLLPRQVYEATLWIRGDNVGVCWFGGGSNWSQRIFLPTGSYGWRPITGQFETGATETAFDLRLNVDSVTQALWVDDVSFRLVGTVIPNGVVTQIPETGLAAARVYPVPGVAAGSLRIDGDPGDWERVAAPVLHLDGSSARLSYTDYGGPQDLSADVRLAYDSQALYLLLDVVDDVFCQPSGGASAWWYDGIQLAFDPRDDRAQGAYVDDDREIGLALGPQGDEVYQWSPNAVAAPAGVTLKTRKGPRGVTYEARIEWSYLDGITPAHGRALGLNILLNDSDNDRRGYLEWTEGIGLRKDPASFATLLLVDPQLAATQPAVHVRLDRAVLYETDLLAGTVWLAGAAPGATVPLQASLDAGGEFLHRDVEIRPPVTSVRLGAELGAVPFGSHKVMVTAGASATATAAFERSSDVSVARELLEGVERDLPALETLLQQAETAKLPTEYQRLRWRVATLFVPYGREDLAHGEVARAVRVGRALRTAVDEARDALLRMHEGTYHPPPVPHYRTGRIEIAGRSFIADTEVPGTGVRERRPVFFTGYGHFPRVSNDIPILPELGANIVQIENGPTSTLPAEDRVDAAAAESFVGGTLARGRDHDVAVCVLVSPHYFPQWAFEKWPALDCIRGGFVRQALDAPESKAVQAKHLGVLLPPIRDYASLHSVCLSNEPTYRDSQADPATRALWPEYLRRIHGTIAAANAAWGTTFARFEDVPGPSGEVPEKEADLTWFYDWCRFNMERFAGWHAWEAGVVRGLVPGLPCHAKIMTTILERRTIGWGVDPELFAQLSQINGNDCCEFYNHARTSTWSFNWTTMGLFYDLQCALAEKPVFNTENHIIVDREQQPIPATHTYTAIWQGAVHGQGATTTWVWERTYDPKHDFAGSILHRPENVIAHGEAGFDLMRLAREVTALQCAPRRVALLYSVTAIVHDPGYLEALSQAYTALTFAGATIGFRSERQIAAGDWGETRLLVVPGVRFVPPEVRTALAAWAAAGGRLVLQGEGCLTLDPYRRPYPDTPAGLAGAPVLTADVEGKGLRDALAPLLRESAAGPLVTVVAADGSAPWGVEWRTGSLDGRPLANLVNHTRDTVSVRLEAPAGAWRDLISGQPLPATIALPPMRPVLATPAP
jgi:hypothetical protein